MTTKPKTATLFEQQSTGGEVARSGFEYQDAYLLQHFPLYLSQAAFSHAVSELLGDIEVRYHRPAGGTYCLLYEAKGYKLGEKELWEEIDRFSELHGKAPDEYVRFVLVCTDYLIKLNALISKLERLRGPGASLNSDSSIRKSAEADVIDTIVKLGQSQQAAEFILARVSFIKYSDADVAGGFAGMLTTHLPTVADMTGRELTTLRAAYKQLVDGSTKGMVPRAALETALTQSAPSVAAEWLATATEVRLPVGPVPNIEELALDVEAFNGNGRGALGVAPWQEILSQLVSLGTFLHDSRQRKAVKVSAKQRMSLACLVGFAFSATRGFTLQMEHNSGQVHDTAKHDRSTHWFFSLNSVAAKTNSTDGVVAICCPSPGRPDVEAATSAAPMGDAPILFLDSSAPISDTAMLNTAVAQAKTALVAFRNQHQLDCIHLFVKAPSFFAMALGHRLNGVGEIQLYDWVGNRYAPTGRLG